MPAPADKLHRRECLEISALTVVLLSMLCLMQPCYANEALSAALTTEEGMKEHDSGDPRRLMHEIVTQEFNKGSVFHIVNLENAPTPTKNYKARYQIHSHLIAFVVKPDEPVRVSIQIQLGDHTSGKKLLYSDLALDVESKSIEEALKLHNSSFDSSRYGKAIAVLASKSVKMFEEKASRLNLPK